MKHVQPRHGGTLRLYGPGGGDQLDPAAATSAAARQILRLTTRQLFTYQAEPDLRDWRAIAPVPDLAVDIPSTYNAGLGTSHLCYVVHLRRGVYWDTEPAREVTAHDVVRGIKRLASPTLRQPALPYFTSTIRGMAEYCAEFAAAMRGRPATPEMLASYQNTREIPGVRAVDDETVVFELVRPALDFIDILAMTCAAPAPVEYDMLLPGGPEFHRQMRATGPYRVGKVTGAQILLEHNPVWRQETDPVRHRYVDRVQVTVADAGPEQVAQRIGSGRADLPWGVAVPEPSEPRPADPDHDLGYALDPYLVMNLRSPSAGRALSNVEVRRAVAYAIDKAAIADLLEKLNTGTVRRVAGGVIPPGNDAHQGLDPYATPGGRGDPEGARARLAAAGYPDGLALTAVYPATSPEREVVRSCAADLEQAGITVTLTPMAPRAYRELLYDPVQGAEGGWDLAILSRWPDWCYGNGRVFLQPMFASDSPGNVGGYHSPEVDRLIEQALDAEEPWRVTEAWQEVERLVLADAVVVPLLFQLPAVAGLRGARVRDAIPMPSLQYAVDPAAVWLAPAARSRGVPATRSAQRRTTLPRGSS
jgi:peptide/nickel transport system substrate-binding protein